MCLGLCATRGTGSQRTLRWRKTDSNLRFPIIRCRFQDGRPVSHDGLMVSRPGTRSSNPVPSSGESVSLPQPVSKGRQPRLSARVCAAGLETGSAETHGVFRYRANRRQYLCRTIFQYRSAAGGLLALPIGWHRARAEHSAGIRTFPLVAMAACGLVQTAISVIGASVPNNANILQGVITGVGFIGAGAIMRQGDITAGTDTAASVWTVGVIGAAVGYGYYDIGIILATANFAVLMLRAPFPGHSSVPESPPGEC